VLRASSHAFIKACLAGKGDSLGKNHNTEQEHFVVYFSIIMFFYLALKNALVRR
jgi:hypothetical protein